MADPYVIFPGTAGNYLSTPDVNVLDCDSSWFAQGTGGLWTVGTPSSEQIKGDSPNSLKVIGGVSTAITPAQDAADFSLFVYSAAGDDFDINGGAPVTAPAGVWSKVSHAGNAGTYTLSAAGAGDYYLAEVMLGAAEFVPSLRIVGDLDIRADIDIAGSTGYIFDRWGGPGASAFRLYQTAATSLRLYFSLDGTTEINSGTLNGFVTGSRVSFQLTRNATSGSIVAYIDGGQIAAATRDAGPLWAQGDRELSVGGRPEAANSTGDYHSAEMRDGIDGPVVAEFLATDIPVAAQLPA